MAQHEFFGELLTAFQLRSLCRRADNGDMPCSSIFLEVIEDALYQRVFGTYYNHVDFMPEGKLFEGGEVRGFYIHILAYCICACIAGSDVQFFYSGALCNLPSQSVFAAT